MDDEQARQRYLRGAMHLRDALYALDSAIAQGSASSQERHLTLAVRGLEQMVAALATTRWTDLSDDD